MAAPFEVELVTPERVVFSGQATFLSVPGVTGSLGILANHAPLLAELKIGEAVLKAVDGTEHYFYIGGGFLEVSQNRVTILAEQSMAENEIDTEEAARLEREGRERLAGLSDSEHAAVARIEAQRGAAMLKVVRRK